jgi:hypothetical protein
MAEANRISEQSPSLQDRLQGSNIHPKSLLATDYLNHFNEVIMLLEMAIDMQEMLTDAAEWQPKSYVQHYMDSQLGEKELAIEAYAASLPQYREPFDTLVTELNEMVLNTIEQAKEVAKSSNPRVLVSLLESNIPELRRIAESIAATVNGNSDVGGQPGADDVISDDSISQDDLDALFD